MTPNDSNFKPGRSATPRHRRPRRQISHEEAHDHGHPTPAPVIIDHPLVPAGEAKLLTRQAEVDALLDRLRSVERFAFDTEFIGEQTYVPRLCLVQIAYPLDDGGYDIALIDPLAGIDLHAFWSLVADASIEKIVHAGEQDLEPVLRHTGRPPRNVFDTQLAAAFAGATYPMSMDNVTAMFVEMDANAIPAHTRRAKFSQWDRRPLTPMQMRYAADDVRYLPLVRDVIGRKLDEQGNAAWAAARCAELCDPALYTFDPQTQRIRCRGVEWLKPAQRGVLRALQLWREEAAREQDVPSRTLLADWVLVELARSAPRRLEDLAAVRGLPRPLVQHYGPHLLQLIESAKASPIDPADADRLPARLPADPLADRLFESIQAFCAERSIDPVVVASKREVAQFVYAQRRGDPAESHRLTRGWRLELLASVLEPARAAIAVAAAGE